MLRNLLVILCLLLSASALSATKKADVVIVETTIVAGKQAPKFLSIVPWRLRKTMPLNTQPIGLTAKALPALEPEELKQTLRLLKTTP